MENLKECSSNKCYCCFGECWYLENKIFLYKTVSCKHLKLKDATYIPCQLCITGRINQSD